MSAGPVVANVAAPPLRRAWAEVDLSAVRDNARLLAELVAPAQLCAVVKAWGYGHGPVAVARAAIDGGASWLAVALVEEGRQLRAAGITAPVLVLSEPPAAAMAEVVRSGLTPTVYTDAGIDAVVAAASAGGVTGTFPVHVKVDTGMHRVGASPDDARRVAVRVHEHPALELQGLWTHFAVADQPGSAYTADQLAKLLTTVDALAASGIRPPLVHAANSAASLLHPPSRLDLVRCGIAIYGLAPSAAMVGRGDCARLQPALSLQAEVAGVKRLAAGERLSYGLRYELPTRSLVANIPLGYADGVAYRLSSSGGQVLIGGRRYPIAGSVTMDQIMVDCGPDSDVSAGDIAVLLGRQGDEEITAWEWAEQIGTIAYEVVCGVSSRVPRTYRR